MPNHLIDQTSPYLLQHAHNPVNWYPWEQPALDRARLEDKPILLSIGYSACHWCHVMEHECFENEAIAEIMNRHFICIKVDREERPDLDKIYQLTHQMLTHRSGGWPLTIALTPNGHAPFFAGTYFPPQARANMPGFGELLEKVSAHYDQNKTDLEDYHLSFNKALGRLNPTLINSRTSDPADALQRSIQTLEKQFDSDFGGFGDAPKFPHPTQLSLLLIASANPKLPESTVSLDMAEKTLSAMAQGGLYDHLGGGFFRYSVDRKWEIPHFEKMLYDNAQLLSLYCDAWQINANPLYADTATQTAQWVIKEMQQSEGGYAATLDADSEGKEGKFYVWSETDLRAILSESQYAILENYFGLFGEPNFEGSWHFNQNPETDYALLAKNKDILLAINEAKLKLLEVRNERIWPGLDNKVLAAWNGLMIKGMAQAGRIFDEEAFVSSAQKAVDFVRRNLWQGNRMLATCTQGKAKLNGYLDDYAFMLEGIIELLQTKWRSSDLEFAIALADVMITQFEDKDNGGFFFTSHDHEKLLYRPKSGADDAIPSGNGAAILGLIKLGHLIGESRYLESAEKALMLFSDDLQRHPSVNGLITIALQYTKDQHATIIIRGDDAENKAWLDYCNNRYDPLSSVFSINKDQKLPPSLAIRKPGTDTVAYICKGQHCTPPLSTLEEFKDYMEKMD